MSALADEFTTTFRQEHRQVRDALLGLIDAFEARDRPRVVELLQHTAALTGPHFRYEEESLYPALTSIFGDPYVETLYRAHDGAIARAGRLIELAGTEPLGDADVTEAVRLIREILPHVSDCDGLSVMVEVLPDSAVDAVLATRARSGAEGLDLVTWATTVRGENANRR